MKSMVLTAEITGMVWMMLKAVGDAVALDEPVAIIESMKMEIPVVASHAGTISALHVSTGDAVSEGQAVVTIALD